jgi:hypothetical protein
VQCNACHTRPLWLNSLGKPAPKTVKFTRATAPGQSGFVEQSVALADLKPGWIVSAEAKHEGDKEVAGVVKVVLDR